MSTHNVPAEHVVPGATILVDGGSIATVVLAVEADRIICEAGTQYVSPGYVVQVVA